MQTLELTLPTAAENLALDEALLDASAVGELAGGILRIWEPTTHFVVLGRSSEPQVEVNLAACREESIPVLRRVSGGGTVLAGPGCLMVSLVLSYQEYPQLRAIDRAHDFVRQRQASALTACTSGIALAGISDLARSLNGAALQKFSGNALRAKRTHLLYHGTLLYAFDLELVSRYLALPTREPEYRCGREHRNFVVNLNLPRRQVVDALKGGWQATEPIVDWPRQRTYAILKEKYENNPQWFLHDPDRFRLNLGANKQILA